MLINKYRAKAEEDMEKKQREAEWRQLLERKQSGKDINDSNN